jgi:hypothetical protein
MEEEERRRHGVLRQTRPRRRGVETRDETTADVEIDAHEPGPVASIA